MKRYLIYICISLGFLFTGCEKSDEYVASPQENFKLRKKMPIGVMVTLLRRFGKYWMRITASSNTRTLIGTRFTTVIRRR